MKRILTIVSALLVLASPAFAERYGWTISSSAVDPNVNEGPVQTVPFSLFLWLACAPDGGMAAFEANFETPPGISNFGFTPLNGFLNAGNSTFIQMIVGGCPQGPLAAGQWTVFGTTAGSFCMVNSINGINVTVNCDPNPVAFDNTIRGFGYGVSPASCNDALCPDVATEAQSWGSVKSLYR